MFGIKQRRKELARLQRLEETVAEYARWFSVYPDFRCMFAGLCNQAQGGAMNAGTVSGNEYCTVSGTREQVERMRQLAFPCSPLDYPGRRLRRMPPSLGFPFWFYVNPDAYSLGSFDSEAAMEAAIARDYPGR